MEVILIGILFLVILVIGHEFGHFFAAKRFGVRVDEFGFGFPPRLFSRKKGETRYSFNLLPFGGFVKIHGEHDDGSEIDEPQRSFINQTVFKRAVIIAAGVFMNFLIGWLAFTTVFAVGIPTRVIVEDVVPNSPAAMAGFQEGDVLQGFESAGEFSEFINTNLGSEIEVNGIQVIPRENPPEGEGALGLVLTETKVERQNFFLSIWSGLSGAAVTTWFIFKAFVGFLIGLLTGNLGVLENISGPVGVFGMLGDVSTLGLIPLIQFLGVISLNLVVVNLIPFPALDGGRLAAVGIEKIIGRKLGTKFELIANGVGLVLLLLIMLAVTIKDIMKL